MIQQNPLEVRNRIISSITNRGPVLTIHIAKEMQIEMIFAGAYLSELLNDKILKISHMKIGSSPLYYIPGQEAQLEKFYLHLNPKEKEAFLLLKDKKILEDKAQDPAIRVALRAIKDFAIPFKKDEEVYWRFHSITEDEIRKMFEAEIKQESQVKEIEKTQVKEEKDKKIENEKITELEKLNKEIEEKKKELEKLSSPKIDKPKKIKQNKLLDELTSFITAKNLDLINVEKSDKKIVIAKLRENGKEVLLFALDQKKLDLPDLIKINKKAKTVGLPYIILSKAETSKKLKETMEALGSLARIEILNNNL